MFKRTKVCTGVLLALGGAVVATSMPAFAQDPQRVEITGSRIKRVDIEGALPITTINREELEASGSTTIAEFMRTVTFASAGNFRPQSGSSAQSFAGVDLRGLGSERTLVLIDGRRLPKAPNVGDSVDLNSVPMAAVERVEILTDGASAVYGSDAIGGVVNFITRKDFEGVQISVGATRPKSDGGDKDEVYAIIGMSSDKGRILAGFSQARRAMVFTNQRPWAPTVNGSILGNNYTTFTPEGDDAFDFTGVPGGCVGENFYVAAGDLCRYRFSAVAADEASTNNHAVFARGEYRINDDWSTYVNASVSSLSSFGRYAPTPSSTGDITINPGSPNNPTLGSTNEPVSLYHRFASAGTRDTTVDNTISSALVGVQGRVADMVDIDFGLNWTKSKYTEFGRNYLVNSLATEAINSGAYDIFNPVSASNQVVAESLKATISRDGVWNQREIYGTGSFDLMQMGGGMAQLLVGAEWREETYKDQYDSLSEAGLIMGSAGNSAGGDRKVTSVMVEAFLPFSKTLEFGLAARFEDYSDYGSDFSPKASFRWKAMPNLALRGSVGTGFRAPSLPVLTSKTSFSAESVFDERSCTILTGDPTDECQISAYIQSNSELDSEKSKQFSFGLVWDPVNWASVKADYWNIKIDDTISFISAQDIVDRDNGDDPRAIPAGLGLTRASTGAITRIDAGFANEGTLKTSGLDLNVVTRFDLGGWGRVSQNYTYSYIFNYKVDGDDIIGDVGSPRARAVFGHNWSYGTFDVTWNINYIASQRDSATRNVGSYITHDLQANWSTPIKGSTLTVGVLNLTDKLPQLVPFDGRNFNFYLYDSYGIQPYVRWTQKF